LRVIARNSAFSFKGKRPDIRDVGKKLDVEHVLEGSVIKFENTIRVTAQLIRVADNSHIWSNRYDSEAKNMLAVQDSISLAIVEALKVKLAKHEQAAMERRPTNNQEAYELYLMGNKYLKYMVATLNKEECEKAISCFERAVALDTRFAEAYLGIAWSYLFLSDIPNARKLLETSLEINNKLPLAYVLKARILVGDFDFPAMEENVKKAIFLNPGLAEAHFWCAMYFRCMGRYDEALGEIERARESDPLYIPTYGQAMAIYMELGRFDKAMEMYRKADEIDPGNVYPRNHLGRLYNFTGRYEEALKIFQENCRIMGTDPKKEFRIGVAYALWGKRDKAEEIIKAIEADKTISGRDGSIAYIYAAMGDNDRAFEWLEKAYHNRDSYLVFLKVELEFRKIRSDPRFKVMLKKIGFPE
jgi:tetratricopeptide (TPR) repeat protein